jgi:phosphatidate cytidylyltransferase
MSVALLFIGVFALDTTAYFCGHLLGGKQLAPTISPKKTWAGAVFGLLGAVAFCLLFKLLPGVLGRTLSWSSFALIGLAIGIFGQLGDLVESAFKRWGGVKDSGIALPGHGGFLDRFDSLFLAAPVVYLLLRFLH